MRIFRLRMIEFFFFWLLFQSDTNYYGAQIRPVRAKSENPICSVYRKLAFERKSPKYHQTVS